MNNDKMVSVPFKALRDFLEHSACTYKAPEWMKNKAALRHAMNQAEQSVDVIREMNDELVDLRARLAERDSLLVKCKSWIESARDGVLYPIANEFQGVVGHNAEGLGQMSAGLLDELDAALSASAEPSAPKCEHKWQVYKIGDEATHCEDCGDVTGYPINSPVERKRHIARTNAVYDASWASESLTTPKCADVIRPVAIVEDKKPCAKHAWQHYPGRDLDYCIFCYERRDHVEGFEGMTDAEADLAFRGLGQ